MSLLSFLFGSKKQKPQQKKQVIDHRIFLTQDIKADTVFEWNNTQEFINQNMAITGGMGAGKTQLIKSLLMDMRQVSKKIIVDYKADYTDTNFLKQINGDMVDLKNEPLPFNPMLGNSFDSNPVRDIKYRLATIINSYSSSMGGKQVGAFRNAVELYLNTVALYRLMEANGAKNFHDMDSKTLEKLKLVDTVDFYTNHKLVGTGDVFLNSVKKYSVTNVNFSDFIGYSKQFDLLDGAFVSETLEPLAEFEIFPSNNVAFEDFMKNGKTSVIVVKNMHSNKMKNLVSHVIIEHLYPYMLANRKSNLYNNVTREVQVLLLIDEAKTIMGEKVESLISILKEGREFGYAVVFGTQYLEDFNQKKGYKYLKYFPTRFNGKNNDEEHKTLKPHYFEVDGEHIFFTPYWQRNKQ